MSKTHDYVARAIYPGPQVRTEGEDGPTMIAGRFSTYNTWTEINSRAEGHFLERFAPGSMTKTLAENGASIRALFQHGMDPQIGDKPLGPVRSLREEEDGAHYEVEPLDASYVNDVIAGLRAGLYGSSFRFRTLREDRVARPGKSARNPLGLPEVTIREAKVRELSVVTFPAYADSTAGMRSITDDLLVARLGLPTQIAATPSEVRDAVAHTRRSTAPQTSRSGLPASRTSRREWYI